MLMPRRVKRRKQFRGRMKGVALRGNQIVYGEYGLVAMEPGWITSNQIEAARIAMTRFIRRGGQVWINIFPDKPVTAKPAETRMGSGKGAPDHWVAVVKPERVMFELAGATDPLSREALRLAMHKLPIKCKIYSREELQEHLVKSGRLSQEEIIDRPVMMSEAHKKGYAYDEMLDEVDEAVAEEAGVAEAGDVAETDAAEVETETDGDGSED